jgi:hypothetical protein
MNCRDATSLLGFEDVDRRVDATALAAHLATCPRCGSEAPEIAALYGASPAMPRRRALGLRYAAAAALLITCGWVFVRGAPHGVSRPVIAAPLAAADSPRATYTTRIIQIDRGRTYVFSFEHHVGAPPRGGGPLVPTHPGVAR